MLAPFLAWAPKVGKATLRADLEAGLIGAIVVLPQGLAFASLAGMPPIRGIYVSIIPVIVAAIWGSSWHTVSGPNAGIAVIVGATVAPLAVAGSNDYTPLVYMLTLMAGLVQFALGMFRLGAVLDFISNTVVAAVIMAIAIVLIVAAGRSLTEISSSGGQSILMQGVDLVHRLPEANPYSALVGAVAIAAGFGAKRLVPKYSLLVAVGAGWGIAILLGAVLGPEQFVVARIGSFDLEVIALVVPWQEFEGDMPQLVAMAPGALSIVLLGMAQTVVMSRSTAKKSGQLIDTNQEIVGQGLMNVSAAFVSAFAGSGSFNRTAVNFQTGARTPLAAVFSSILLLVLLLLAADAVALIPAAAIGGTLFVVGIGLMDFKAVRTFMRSGAELIAWLATLMVALAVGLNEAILTGIMVSLVNYLWRASKPNLRLSEHYSRDGRLVSTVTLDGNLFFGAVQYIERALAGAGRAGEPGIFLIRTDHLTYLDVPGAQLIAEEAKRRQGNGDDVYVYVSRKDELDALDRAGALGVLGDDGIIHRDRDHPAKELLSPHRPSALSRPTVRADADMGGLAAELRKIRMFSPFPTAGLQTLLEQAGLCEASAGEPILSRCETADNHVLLLDGAVEVERSWTTMDGVQKNSIRLVEASAGVPSVITASPRGLQLRAMSEVRFVTLDAAAIDEIAGRGASAASDSVQEGLGRSGIMRELAPEQLQRVLEAMVPVEIEAGEPVVRQGDPGEEYFLIEEGDAEVWREDAFTSQSSKLAVLGPGDTFGEEALLQGGYRNATVRMATPGRLQKLSKTNFDRLLKEPMAREIGAEEARQMVESGSAVLLDCRYDLEIRESRIPGARALPLDQIRNLSHRLEPGPSYLLYCRNGQRSRVAAFLLKERGLEALSVAGGIAGWPYDIDLGPVEDIDKLIV